ncbi:metallophosphoesterase [Chitinophaga barathri]|nr:metallophosphoesterase [Chitinophaga barathri]
MKIPKLLICLLIVSQELLASETAPAKILVKLEALATSNDDTLSIQYYDPFNYNMFPGPTGRTEYYDLPAKRDIEISATSAIVVVINQKKGNQTRHMFLLPGNNITLQLNQNKIDVSGDGSQTYDFLYKDLYPKFNQLHPPGTAGSAAPTDLKDFTAWNTYLDKKSEILHHTLTEYSTLYPSPIWNIIKATFLSSIENTRQGKFYLICVDKKKYRLDQSDIRNLYDSLIHNNNLKWLLSQTEEMPIPEQYYRFLVLKQHVLYDVNDPENMRIFANPKNKYLNYFQLIEANTQGRFKDQLLTYLLLSRVAKGGNTPLANELAESVYPKLDHDGYKQVIKQGLSAYALAASNSGEFWDFLILDKDGNRVSDFKNKVIILHLNKRGNINQNIFFQSAYKKFSNNPNILFAIVSGENEKASTKQQKTIIEHPNNKVHRWYAPHSNDYLDFNLLNLGPDNVQTLVLCPTVNYHISIYHPYIRKKLRISDTDSARLDYIEKQVTKTDGPFVYYSGDTCFVHNIRNTTPFTDTIYDKHVSEQNVYTDSQGSHFKVSIMGKAQPTPSIYPQPEKMLVLSDLEGNYKTLREFLLNHHVIDKNYNWTFGKAHLVIAGDIFDRGTQVTACLWLIYSLEEKAKAAGGFVHFILGNHEVMNLTGKLSYVHKDYFQFATMLGRSYEDLLGLNSVLGQWLRSKNIIEVIGENLVTHGGISPQVNRLKLPIKKINDLHFSYLNKATMNTKDSIILQTIINSKVSPYWYREYYTTGNTFNPKVIDTTLQTYKVSRIITGHTIVPDVISYYGGKVINTDTHHASGDSEGLMIENGLLYRVMLNGNKELLP